MRPHGHLAAGVLLGHLLHRRLGVGPLTGMAAGALAANLPDADVAVCQTLNVLRGTDWPSHEHHAWPTHTPALWVAGAAALAWAGRPRVAELVGAGALVHLGQDMITDAVPVAAPLSWRRRGLRLDQLGTMPHLQWMRAYRGTRAHKLERVLMVGAGALAGRELLRRR